MRRLLPPLLVGLLLIVLFALSRVERPIDPLPVSSAMIGWACIPVALIGLAVARRQFSKASAEIMTFDTPRNLVTDGLFAYSRNPMYLSMLLLVLGAALIAGHWAGLLMPLVFLSPPIGGISRLRKALPSRPSVTRTGSIARAYAAGFKPCLGLLSKKRSCVSAL